MVAITVLHHELAGAIGVDRFGREIRLTARLQHPHIVPVLDSGAFTGPNAVTLPWHAMAFIGGDRCRARLDRERHLPIEQALRITEQAAAALHAARLAQRCCSAWPRSPGGRSSNAEAMRGSRGILKSSRSIDAASSASRWSL